MKSMYLLAGALAMLTALGCADYNLLEEGPDPVAVEVVSSTDSTVTIRWRMSTDENFWKYSVYYSTSDIVDTTDNLADTAYFRQDTMKTVEGLDANRQYFFRVIVHTTGRQIAPSNVANAWTQKDSRTFELFNIDSAYDTSVVLMWEKSAISDFKRYLVHVDTMQQNVDTNDTPLRTIRLSVASDTVCRVGELDRATTYWFKVHVENTRDIVVSSSNADSATTLGGQPDSVVLTRTAATDTAVSLSWTAAAATDFTKYVVFFDTIPSIDTFTVLPAIATKKAEIPVKTTVSTTVGGLSALKQYWFCIYVADNSGLISPSNVVVNFPVILFASDTTDSSVTLGWTRADSERFEAYAIYRSATPGVTTTSTLVTTTPITNNLTMTFADTTVDSASTYYYKLFVLQKNPSGQEGSNEIVVVAE